MEELQQNDTIDLTYTRFHNWFEKGWDSNLCQLFSRALSKVAVIEGDKSPQFKIPDSWVEAIFKNSINALIDYRFICTSPEYIIHELYL